MDKKSKIIVIILTIFIVIILAFLGYTYTSKLNNEQAQDTNQVYAMNETIKENTVENVENNVIENVVENVIQNNTVTENKQNVIKNETKKEEPTKPVASDKNSEVQVDNDEDKAIAIVKKDWGDTSGVAFRVEQINSDGTYVISVRDEDSMALDWYTVNPKTGEFTK